MAPLPSQSHRERTYRGGFSASFCDLFSNPHRKSDCCALVCCGILQSDQNEFLLTKKKTSSFLWVKRIAIYLGLPLLVAITIRIISDKYATTKEAEIYALLTTFIAVFLMLLGFGMHAKRERTKLRLLVMTHMYQSRYGATADQQHDEDDGRESATVGSATVHASVTLDAYLKMHHRDAHKAHGACGCFPVDVIHTLVNNDIGDDIQGVNDAMILPKESNDCGTLLWKIVAKLCCGWCCGCWCTCFGMCATNQEYREIDLLVSKKSRMIDYVTFEPYRDYYGKIVELRRNQVWSFLAHCRAVSQLSANLLRMLGLTLLCLLVLAILHVFEGFQIENFLVVVGTFSQAFSLLFFIHWRRNRFYLSFDAVVKYFSSGFLLCTGLALTYEFLVSSFLQGTLVVIMECFLIEDLHNQEENGSAQPTNEQIQDILNDFKTEHPVFAVLAALINAFLVAAMVEELAKYSSFWCVEHPDFLSPEDLATAMSPPSDATSDNSTTISMSTSEEEQDRKNPSLPVISGERVLQQQQEEQKTLLAHGRSITIAMVATALGFACCENLVYVFVYAPPNISNEISTLLLRALFPVHPLMAAIQSIGVCRRDLEGDKSFGLGRIILPAFVLHGSFDSVLMVYATLTTPTSNDEEQQGEDVYMIALIVFVTLLGICFYACKASAQKSRLSELDQSRRQGEESTLLA